MSIQYKVSPTVNDAVLNELFLSAWKDHQPKSFSTILEHSLAYIGAFAQERLIGFVNIAWDGGIHGFILDTTVHRDFQRQGIGKRLIEHAIEVAKYREIEWLHVDYEPHLDDFYRSCGFRNTDAGLLRL